MPSIKKVGKTIRESLDRFDGGYNVNDSPSFIDPSESPDCLNVAFDERGAVVTRGGSDKFNTTAIGSFPIDGGISYGQTMIVWANGTMYRNSGPSGTTFTAVTSSSGKFSAGAMVAASVYQNVLFCSDGTNGPWKYTGSENFYNMGIDTPSAPTGASLATAAGTIQPGTYYHAISYVNTQVVEGQIGSASAGATLTATSFINLTGVPVGSSLAGVNQRFVYRSDAASGPWRKVGTISNNTATTFTDSTANGGEGKFAILDGSKPSAFTTIQLHQERLFWDDATNRSLLRWSNFTNPYISEVENFEPFNNGDGESILAISSQDNFLTVFKNNRSWSLNTTDPSDIQTWKKNELPSNLGIVGPRAFARIANGIIFVGRRNNKITGFHFLTGIQVIETNDGKLRSLTISENIEPDILTTIHPDYLSSIACVSYNNRLYTAYTNTSGTTNSRIFWLDTNRVTANATEFGSWAPWSGINSKSFFIHNGLLFSADATSTGFVRQLEKTTYNDSGSAIDSYFWTKELGGGGKEDFEQGIEAYIKDFRDLYIWHEKVGSYDMNVRTRVDGDTAIGTQYMVDLSQGTGLWGQIVWGVDRWGGTRTDVQTRIPIGRLIGRRIQIRFDNQNTLNQGFKVHRIEIDMNLRRRRN